eukprot:1615405-Rhodomonas_salina.2
MHPSLEAALGTRTAGFANRIYPCRTTGSTSSTSTSTSTCLLAVSITGIRKQTVTVTSTLVTGPLLSGTPKDTAGGALL